MNASALLCASHSPLNYCYARKPARWDEIEQVYRERRSALRAFDPELVFAFGSDHFNGFFMKLMPAFCVGAAAQSAADIGGFEGPLNVPGDTALDCVQSLRQSGLDPAVSYDMTVDHAFSQTLTRVLGGLDRYPTIPVFINCVTEPFVPFKRTRLPRGRGWAACSRLLRRDRRTRHCHGHRPRRLIFGTGGSSQFEKFRRRAPVERVRPRRKVRL